MTPASVDDPRPSPKDAPEAAGAERTPEEETRRTRRLTLLALLGTVVVITLIVAILMRPEPAEDPIGRASNWDSPDIAEPQDINLSEGDYEAVIIVGADSETCWDGFIGSETIEGCGDAVYNVSGAPRVLGANVRHNELEKRFLGISLWTHGQRLQKQDSTKRNTAVAVSGSLI